MVLREGNQAFAKGRSVAGRNLVLYVVAEVGAVRVKSTTISAAQALVHWAVKPDYRIQATGDQRHWGLLLGVRLHKQLGFLHVALTLSCLELLKRLVAAEGLFKKFSLGVAVGEVNQDPAVGGNLEQSLHLGLKSNLLGL